MNSLSVCHATPALKAVDPRGLCLREVAYCRSEPGQLAAERVTRFNYDLSGRQVASWDPRHSMSAGKEKTSRTGHSLSGNTLLNESADAGWRVSLLSEAKVEHKRWDGRGCERTNHYDQLQRTVAVQEGMTGEVLKYVERFTYAAASASMGANHAGRLIRQDDLAGALHEFQYSMDGSLMGETRQFLCGLDAPDWPLDFELRNKLLLKECFVTTSSFNALGEMRLRMDASGNSRSFDHSLSGQIKAACLLMAGTGQPAYQLVSDIRCNASGQVESEQLGNGVTIVAEHEGSSGRLRRLAVMHPGSTLLQDQIYTYDAVGNVLSVEDKILPVRYHKNQRINSVSRYRYDSLYQLIEGSGREIAPPVYGPCLPCRQRTPINPERLRNYIQTFDYDAAGNLLARHHDGAPTIRMAVSEFSNRSLGQHEDGGLPDEQSIANGFDANGNQRVLWRGQYMSWSHRNQLSRVTMVSRKSGTDDDERYVYDGFGRRVRKERSSKAHTRTIFRQALYLPGLEIHQGSVGKLRIVDIDLGLFRVRVRSCLAASASRDCDVSLLYGLKDNLGSGVLELDEQAGLVTQERYYPFGGTAWHASRSDTDAYHKTIRYSDKERDATGLYYYGFRYYAPWLCRWINPDPAGTVYGQNLYQMTGNRPVSMVDRQGLMPVSPGTESLSFWQPDLKQRLERNERSRSTQLFIRENFITDAIEKGSHEVSSTYLNEVGGNQYESWFINEFREDTWIFKQNYKTTPPAGDTSKLVTHPRFYASDVARYQYELISTERGFYGRLPSVIKRENVMNYSALSRTSDPANNATTLMNDFLTQTPNGKSTQRIMEDFGLEAISVERVKGEGGQIDFLINVRPSQQSSVSPHENEVVHDSLVKRRYEAESTSHFFGVEPIKGSFRRGSIEMARMERRGSDWRL